MPVYKYKVKNESGRILAGEAKFQSRDALVSALSDKGLEAVEIFEKNVFTDISQISIFKKRVKIKDLAIFCRQFAIVLEAGVPISMALDVLREQATNPTMRDCLNDIYESIQKGIALSHALKQFHGIFPEILINMVEAGEVSGQLDRVFVRMADHFEKEFKLNQKVQSAMTYPVIVLVIAAIVIFIMMANVVPTFADVLTSMGSELPTYTKILIGISMFFKKFWWLVALAIIALVCLGNVFSKSDSGRYFYSMLAIKLPILKDVTKTVMTARLTRTLGTLVASGVLLIQSLEIVQKVLGNIIVAEKIEFVIDEVKKGKGLTGPLTSVRYFPPMLNSMVRIGEESGDLDFALEKSADYYDQEVEAAIQKLVTFIEPLIMILLGGVVGFIILSILYPMISVYQNMG